MTLLLASASGCERTEAGEAAALREAQDAVLAASNAVPQREGQTSVEARLEALDAAAANLKTLAASANPQRSAIAERALSEIDLARAQGLSLRGQAASAGLRSDLGRLLAALDSAEGDAARAEALRLDPGAAISRVEAAKSANAAELQRNRSTAERLEQEAASVEERLAAATRQRTDAARRESALVDAAFLQGGDERQTSLEAANAANELANAAASVERDAEIRLGQLRRESELATTRAGLASEGVERMEAAGRGFADAGSAAEASVAEAARASAAKAAALATDARTLSDRFSEDVLGPLDAAVEAAKEASERLERASAEPLLLAQSRITAADTGAAAVLAAESFGSGLRGLATRLRPLDAAAAEAVAGLAEELANGATTRRAAAAETLTTAKSALEEAPAEAPAAASLRAVADRLGSLLPAG